MEKNKSNLKNDLLHLFFINEEKTTQNNYSKSDKSKFNVLDKITCFLNIKELLNLKLCCKTINYGLNKNRLKKYIKSTYYQFHNNSKLRISLWLEIINFKG